MATTVGHFAIMPGTLVYVDAYPAGLVPAKVTATHSPTRVTVRVTADRMGWKRGEVYTGEVGHIVPRTMVSVRSGQYRIAGFPVVAYPAPAQDYTPEG